MMKPENDIQDVLDHLSVLEPAALDGPRPASHVLAQVKQQIEYRKQNRWSQRLGRYLVSSNRRFALAAVLSILLFGLAFSFPSVRAAASDFLGLFRVQKFAAISISPEQIALLERVAEQGLTPGEFEMLGEPGPMEAVSSVSEASATIGLPIRTLAHLGEPGDVYVTAGGSSRLTIDLEGARAILVATGVDPMLLPDSLDGQQVKVDISPGVEQRWADGTWLLQMESPLVEYPASLEPDVLGQALLQVLGMNEEESLRLSRSIDWTSTLLLPVPQDLASFSEVTVNGVSSLALSSLDGARGVVMWQKEGIVYLLNAPGSTADLVSLVNSLQ